MQSRRLTRSVPVGRRYAHAPAAFNWRDPLGSDNLFTEEELAIAETAESYCQERLLPRVLGMSFSFLSIYRKLTRRLCRCVSK